MHVAVVFALLQQPAAPASFPITKVEITPPAAEIEIGQTVRLAARALDARGQPVADAKIAWLSGGTEGDVDSTGLVKGGYHGYVRVTAVAYLPGQQGQVFGDALIHVLPEPAARIDVTPAPAKVVAGTRLTLAAGPSHHHYRGGGWCDGPASGPGDRQHDHPARRRAGVERGPHGRRGPLRREREGREGPRGPGRSGRVGRSGDRRRGRRPDRPRRCVRGGDPRDLYGYRKPRRAQRRCGRPRGAASGDARNRRAGAPADQVPRG